MVERKTAGERIFTVFNTALLVFLSLIMLYPMLYEVFVSLSDPIELSKARGAILWPQGFSTMRIRGLWARRKCGQDIRIHCSRS